MAKVSCYLKVDVERWTGDIPTLKVSRMAKRVPSADGFWVRVDLDLPDEAFFIPTIRARLTKEAVEAATETDAIVVVENVVQMERGA